MYKFNEDDAYRFAREMGIRTFKKGDELIFKKCPYCGSESTKTNKSSINLSTGLFHCFRASCGHNGNMITLAKDFNFSLSSEVDAYYGIGNVRRYRTFKKQTEPIEPKDAAIEFMKSRGISETVCRKYQITADEQGNIVFPFLDEEGQMQFIKYRNPDPEEGQSKEWCERDCKPILFGIYQCDLSNKTLILTEGQMDSLSVAEAGIQNAVSVPTGANGFTWVPHCWNWLMNFEKIIVFGDHEKGHITLYNEMATRLGSKIWHVQEEDYKDCKDANDILRKYGADQIRKCVEDAIQQPIPKTKKLELVKMINPYDVLKMPTGIKKLDKILFGGLPFGYVTLITGKAGEGKSTFASQLLLSAIESEHKVFAYSGELPNYLFKSWLNAQAAGLSNMDKGKDIWNNDTWGIPKAVQDKLDEWYKNRFWIYDNTVALEDDPESLTSLIERTINQYGVDVILIDNLMTALDLEGQSGLSIYEKQSIFMKKLARLSIQYKVLIIVIAHKRKESSGFGTPNDAVSGSSDITNLVSVILSYERKRSKDEPEASGDQRILKVTKNRLFGNIETYGFVMNYEEGSKRVYQEEKERNKEYKWEYEDGFKQAEIEEFPF